MTRCWISPTHLPSRVSAVSIRATNTPLLKASAWSTAFITTRNSTAFGWLIIAFLTRSATARLPRVRDARYASDSTNPVSFLFDGQLVCDRRLDDPTHQRAKDFLLPAQEESASGRLRRHKSISGNRNARLDTGKVLAGKSLLPRHV